MATKTTLAKSALWGMQLVLSMLRGNVKRKAVSAIEDEALAEGYAALGEHGKVRRGLRSKRLLLARLKQRVVLYLSGMHPNHLVLQDLVH